MMLLLSKKKKMQMHAPTRYRRINNGHQNTEKVSSVLTFIYMRLCIGTFVLIE